MKGVHMEQIPMRVRFGGCIFLLASEKRVALESQGLG